MALVRRPAAIVPSPRALALVIAAVVCAAARPAGAARAQAPLALAVVVGSNRAPSAPQDNLRFGDDDAIQSARTLGLLGIDAALLVSPDAETRELYPALQPAGPATPPSTKTAVQAAGRTPLATP